MVRGARSGLGTPRRSSPRKPRTPVSSISLVSRDNGVGLSTDMALLTDMLTGMGHTVSRVDWTRQSMPRVDVAIFLELWAPRLAAYAGRKVGIFNLEWFEPAWAKDLPSLDQLWAKSLECHNVYTARGLPSTYTGFLSKDMRTATPATLSCLHVRGHSDLKHTAAVLEAWACDPGLPPLTVISWTPLKAPAGVRVLGQVSPETLKYELNTAAIHVCPSQAEGWGHYITEGLSTGALVVTTNASPMNEHVHPDWGVLIDPRAVNQRGYLAGAYHVTAQDVCEAVRFAAMLPPATRAAMSTRARAHFEKRNHDFRVKAAEMLARL